jgi:antagonist of KipI
MSIHVVKSGILDTLQDNGRIGFSKWGVNPNGAMDFYAMQMANALVGNELNKGVIELHFPAGEFVFSTDCLISITGADFDPRINGFPVSMWKSLMIREGSTLSFKKKKHGARCCVGVRNGIAGSEWLGSVSTNLRISASLKKGSELGTYEGTHYRNYLGDKIVLELPWSVNHTSAYAAVGTIAILAGHEWEWLTIKSQHDMVTTEFKIGLASDRMAYQLITPPLEYKTRVELISSAVSFGTMQGLPDGSVIILMADHQTTGGYPRIAHVASADLPKLSQLSPNERITFRRVTVEEAEKMLFSLVGEIRMVQQNCRLKLQKYHAIH